MPEVKEEMGENRKEVDMSIKGQRGRSLWWKCSVSRLYQYHHPNFDFVSLFCKMLSLGKTGESGQRISLYFFIQLAACESTILWKLQVQIWKHSMQWAFLCMWSLCFASLDCIPGGEISLAIVLRLLRLLKHSVKLLFWKLCTVESVYSGKGGCGYSFSIKRT